MHLPASEPVPRLHLDDPEEAVGPLQRRAFRGRAGTPRLEPTRLRRLASSSHDGDRRPSSRREPGDGQRALLSAVREIATPVEGYFACLYFAGLRPAEAANLRAADCRLPNREGWGAPVAAVQQPLVDGHRLPRLAPRQGLGAHARAVRLATRPATVRPQARLSVDLAQCGGQPPR